MTTRATALAETTGWTMPPPSPITWVPLTCSHYFRGGGAYRNFQIFANRNNLIKFLTLGNVINVLLYKFLWQLGGLNIVLKMFNVRYGSCNSSSNWGRDGCCWSFLVLCLYSVTPLLRAWDPVVLSWHLRQMVVNLVLKDCKDFW